ncbi:FG-GAP-like repeat-containing protein [Roseiconus lacunae]|uniref:FG-GAP-like repeat-containing protein n=1 Tax=Roseiconus lacunae TaxID=2605694 RepID=A0ABT7PMT8_9BACT|nr:FG-GAP-like repeat-containing protein [Roseiconus lacunae]MDM4017814.1 FG-GAP-like repeat-containing protein [Roseiconus lacunae]
MIVPSLCLAISVGCGASRQESDSPATQLESDPALGTPAGKSHTSSASRESLIGQVTRLARSGQFALAEQALRPRLVEFADDTEVLQLAGDLAVAMKQPSIAIDRYQAAIDAQTTPSVLILDKIGRQWMQLAKPFRSIEVLQQMVLLDPSSAATRRDLAGLQASLGLERRAREHLQSLVQHNQAGVDELLILSDLSRPQTDEEMCNYVLSQNPGDQRPRYALVRPVCYDNRWADAIDSLRQVWSTHPEFAEASAYYGRAIVETDSPENDQSQLLKEWLATVGSEVRRQPQYWLAAGRWAERQAQNEQAVRAYWNAVQLDENSGEALSRLANLLAQIGHAEESAIVSKRAQAITAMRDQIDSLLYWRRHSQRAAVEIARSMQTLGRIWEAANWARAAVRMSQDPVANANEVFLELKGQLTAKTPWQDPTLLVASRVDVDRLPTPRWESSKSKIAIAATTEQAAIRFSDEAKSRNLNHRCKIAPPADGEAGLWIYQSGAGGASAIDYDHDGWPDLYMTVCDGQPRKGNSSTNRFYRNRNGVFSDVTDLADCRDQSYSQGVASGDINSDGFPDLYVGVFGQNRLLINQGDGTFIDATETSQFQSNQEWTTSVAIADLDVDGLAELFDVQYVSGDDVVTRRCFPDELTVHRSCGPLVFPAQHDRVHSVTDHGRIVDQTQQWLAKVQAGRGLGLVVGQLDQAPGIDVYVANDMTANHFWSGRIERDSARPEATAYGFGGQKFQEQGAARGVAFNARSLSQASMGIAADDADNDGDLDFYVTHFSDDYNTVYQQVHDGVWSDRTDAWALVDPTIRTLGYGTQWLDADSDGTPELVVANGHVDDFTHSGQNYRMPMQLFRRAADDRYQPVDAASIGESFASPQLARALLTADFNRDRKLDFVVTRLFEPAGLFINHTDQRFSTIEIRLVGTQCHRDAVGAIVTLRYAERAITKYRLAGNGYQCGNEQDLRFACDEVGELDQDSVISATIVWPDGSNESHRGLTLGQRYLWVQGQGLAADENQR